MSTGRFTATEQKHVDLAPGQSSDDASIRLVQEVIGQHSRTDAVAALARFVAKEIPGCTVRCGLGSARMKRFADARLGWLGPASEIYQRASLEWEAVESEDRHRVSIESTVPVADNGAGSNRLRINLGDQEGFGRCLLWIESDRPCPLDLQWIDRAVASLRMVIWNQNRSVLDSLGRALQLWGMSARVCLAMAALVLVLLSVWPVSYRVRCTTVVIPELSRVIAAPFAATLESSHVQPGDLVAKGDVLLTLDGRPLRLELASLEAQLGQIEKERDIAKFNQKVAETQQATLRLRELTRRYEMISERFDKLSVTSPIDGMVVRGQLDRTIGAPLEMGQGMLEIAPLENMVIELEVPEFEIGYLRENATARVSLNAMDGESFDKEIDRIYPTAEIRDDQNIFVARINVSNDDGKLKPGMRGEAIVYGPVRPWLWSIARSVWEKTLWWIGY